VKKMLLGLSLAVAALGFLTSPAVAASAPVLSVSDQAFLASLAKAPGGTPAPELAARRPTINPKSLCTATANCWNGGTVSCSSNTSTSSCSAVDGDCNVGEQGHVTCDGVTTACPTACPFDCDQLFSDCELNCEPCPIKFFQCNPYRCRCNFLNCGF